MLTTRAGLGAAEDQGSPQRPPFAELATASLPPYQWFYAVLPEEEALPHY